MDNKRNSKDRNAQQPNNGQMMTELKYLKATLAAKDKRIKELEESLKQVAVLGAQVKELEARVAALQDPLASSGTPIAGSSLA